MSLYHYRIYNQYREFQVARGNLATGSLERIQGVLKDLFILRHDFNQLDVMSKVMYRHEIMCTGNTAQFN